MIYLHLFYIFFKVGIFGFGGGYAILPMIYQEIQTFGIVTPEDFSNLVALSQVTPGPIAINAATYVGYKAAGLGGAAMATFAVSLPSFLLIVLVMASVHDIRKKEIPFWMLAACGSIAVLTSAVGIMDGVAAWNESVYALIPGVLLLLTAYVSRQGLGYGDGLRLAGNGGRIKLGRT